MRSVGQGQEVCRAGGRRSVGQEAGQGRGSVGQGQRVCRAGA